MKAVKASIQKTIEFIQSKFGQFDYDFYSRMVVSGLAADGFQDVVLEDVGSWLTCLDPKTKHYVEIDIRKPFDKLPKA